MLHLVFLHHGFDTFADFTRSQYRTIGKATDTKLFSLIQNNLCSGVRRTTEPAVATVKAWLYRNKNILTCARRQCTRVTSTRLFASTVARGVHLERVVFALAFELLAVRRTQVGCAFRKSAESRTRESLLCNAMSSIRHACHHRQFYSLLFAFFFPAP